MSLHTLIWILSIAVKKHGAEKPLTLGHLLNILKMAKRYEVRVAEHEDEENDTLMAEIRGDGQF